ncbi:MAG: hypothetical protein ACI81W_001732, partial [Saprospiraceae bacterium]
FIYLENTLNIENYTHNILFKAMKKVLFTCTIA